MTDVHDMIDRSTIVRRSLHGVLLSTEASGETTYSVYDAFARVAQTWRAAILAATGTTGVPPVGGSGVSPLQPGYRITQHFYDALGRETNTVSRFMIGLHIFLKSG